MKAWSVRGVVKLASTTCAAEASAFAASPRCSTSRERTFPFAWMRGAPGRQGGLRGFDGRKHVVARPDQVQGFTGQLRGLRRDKRHWRLRRSASLPPRLPTSASQPRRAPCAGCPVCPATSQRLQRLGSARAAEASRDRSLARGWGDLSTAPKSMPGSMMSST